MTSSSLRQPIRRIAERAQIETNSLSSFPFSDSPIPNILHHRSLQTEKPKLPGVRPVISKASKSRADLLIESLKLASSVLYQTTDNTQTQASPSQPSPILEAESMPV
ncbi:unnamed protein product [Prunus armeniaca]